MDTAVFSGTYGQSTISIVNGVLTVTGPDGTDTIENVENFAFTESPNLIVGLEDTAISLDVAEHVPAAENATSIVVFGVPSGAELSAGTLLEDGSWLLNSSDLDGLTITGAANSAQDFTLGINAYNADYLSVISQAAADYLDDQLDPNTNLPLQSLDDFLSEGGSVFDLINGPAQSYMPNANGAGTVGVEVIGVVDPFSITIDGVEMTADGSATSITFAGTEDQEIPLNIVASLTDTDGSEVVSVTISGLPALEVVEASREVPLFDEEGQPLLDENGIQLTETETYFEPVTDAAGNPVGAHLVYTDANGNDVVLPPNSTGTYDLSSEQLSNLRLVGSPDDSDDFDLEFSAQVRDGEAVDTVFGSATVVLAAQADVPTVIGSAETGIEDQPLSINFDIDKNDVSEHITDVTLTGIPAGSKLAIEYTDPDSGETMMVPIPVVNGSASIPLGFLGEDMSTDNLQLTPPAHLSGLFNLQLNVTSTEPSNGDVAVNNFDLPLEITAVADELGVTVNGTSVLDGGTVSVDALEDGAFALDISAMTADTDGSEVISITISGVPAGATLSKGVDNGDGTWTLTPEDADGLTVTPPLNSDVDFDLGVTVTNVDNNQDVSTLEATVSVGLEAVADTANLEVDSTIEIVEDFLIPIGDSIDASLVDTDGSESLSITISGLPAGSVLSAGTENDDGSWTLTPQQLSGLTMTPGLHVSGAFDLTVTATTTEAANLDTAAVSQQIGLTILPDPDAPEVTVTSAQGNEDAAISLNIDANLVDTDGSETLSISISGVPVGAVLSAGTEVSEGVWEIDPADLADLKITPPLNSNEDFNLTVTATATESNGEFAETVVDVPVSVLGVADAPDLMTDTVTALEGTNIPLNIVAQLGDTDGSETLSITIDNIPNGAFLQVPARDEEGAPLLDDLGEIVYNTLQVVDHKATLTPDQLDGLVITPPVGSDEDFDLLVTATATENDNDISANGQGVASVSGTLSVIVHEVADPPALMLFDSLGNEDVPVPLNIAAILTDADETLSVTVSNLPEGVTLSKGTQNDDGTWSLEPGDLAGLTMITPENYSGEFSISVEATSTTDDGTFATQSGTLNVAVRGVADAPNLDLVDLSADEGSLIPLNVAIGAGLADTDGSETLSITISNLPEGAQLFSGVTDLTDLDALSSLVPLNIVDGAVELTAEQLEGLVMLPPAGLDEDFTLQVTATATEADAALTGNEQGVASVSGVINVDMTAVADVPTLILQNASGNEDSAIPLDIGATIQDASETLSITIANVPAGAMLSAGSNNNDGTWTLTPAQLENLTITPPADSNEDFQLEITATSTEEDGTTASTTASLSVGVTGVADAPSLNVSDASGLEDLLVPLNISSNLADTDGSETLSITITGMPVGAMLSAGTKNPDGSWTLSGQDLDGLNLVPAADASGNFSLTVTATSTENDGDTSSVTGLMNINLGAVADVPTLVLHDAAGFEDDAIPLEISTEATGGDEIVGITISGLPNGASLSAGTNNGNGTWTLTEEQLEGLTITPPENSNANFQLSVTVTSMDGDDLAEATQAMNVSVTGVADKPLLNVPSQITIDGVLDAADLDIESSLTDLDGSESLSVSISNIPTGAVVSLGNTVLDVVGGVVDGIQPNQLAGLQITPPAGFNGNFTLQVTATATETDPDSTIPDGLETSVSIAYIDVTVDGVIPDVPDVPNLELGDALGYEDNAIPLDIEATLTDLSETLSVTISNVPAGATLSNGTDLGNGTWSLLPEELDGLSITPPADSNVDFDLTVTATSTTEDGSIATNTGTLPVDVIGVADEPNLAVTIGEGTVVGDALPDVPAFDNAISNVVMYLKNEDGSVDKIKVEGFDGAEDIHDVNDLDLHGFVADNYPGAELVGVSVKAGNNDVVLTARGEGEFFLVDPGTVVNLLPLLSNPDQTFNFNDSLDDYVGGTSGELMTVFPLNITSSLNDTDGSETLSLNISDLPSGVTLSAGTQNQDGSWTLTEEQLDGLTMSVPVGTDLDFDFNVTATATENDGDTASVSLGVGVDGDTTAQAPDLSVSDAAGDEDTDIPLDIAAALTDTDGSEMLSITISGVPNGAALSAGTNNGDGSWTLTPEQLAGLTVTPPADSDVDFTLTVEATSTELSTGDTAVVSGTIPVTVNAVADAPNVAAGDGDGDVGQTVPLAIESILSDTDGSETLSINIAGFPDGASLNAGALNNDGSYTLSVQDLDGLAITLPDGASDDFDLTVTATSTELANSDQASNVVTAAINVDPLANDDRNVVEIGEVTSGNVLTGEGDSADPSAAADVGSESGNSVVDVSFGGVTKSFGNPEDVQSDADGNYIEIAGDHGTLKMYQDGSYDYAADESEAVSHVAGLTGTASSSAVEEAWSGVQTFAFDFGTTYVNENGQFDPALADGQVTYTSEGIGVAGTQNGMPVPDQINHDNDIGESQALGINLGGSTSSATLTVSRLFNNEDGGEQGVWQAYDGDGNLVGEGVLNASTVDYSGSSNTGTAEISLPDGASFQYLVFTATDTGNDQNQNDSSDFFVRAVQYDTNAAEGGEDAFTYTMQDADGDTASASLSINVSEEQDTTASDPTLNVTDAAGLEDNAIALDIAAGLGDLDGSETLSITVAGVPNGAVLSAGTNNNDGTWTVSPEDLAGLSITPPTDSNDDFQLTVTATSTEENGGDTATATATINVGVTGVADAPTLAVTLGEPTETQATGTMTITNMGQESAGYENSYGYYVKDAEGNPTEGLIIWDNTKQQIGETFTLEGVDPDSIGFFVIPNGDTENAGLGDNTAVTFEQDGQGNWHVVGPDGNRYEGTGDPVLFSDPALNEGNFDYTTDNNVVGNQNWEDLFGGGDNDFNDVNINVNYTPGDGSGTAEYPLNIASELRDTDGSEELSITVSGLPEGASLSAGTVNQNGSVTLTPQQLVGLTMTVALGTEDFQIGVTATTTENDGDIASVSTTVGVNLPDGDTTAESPDLTAYDVSGDEDNWIALDINSSLTDIDGSESLSITIAGVPADAMLNAGTKNNDGTWTLEQGDLDGLAVRPDEHSDTDMSLTITATSTESSTGDTASQTATMSVTVNAVADAPTLTATLGQGTVVEGDPVAGETTTVFSSNFGSSDVGFVESLDGWSTNSDAIETWDSSSGQTGDGAYIELNDDAVDYFDDATSINREFPTEEGATYTLTFRYSPRPGYDDDVNRMDIRVDGQSIETVSADGSNNADNVWQTQTVTFTGTGEPMNLEFLSTGVAQTHGRGMRLDDVVLTETTVDEPGDTTIEYPLDISAILTDQDGSEELSINVGNLPDGATLSAGSQNNDGSWTLTTGQLAGLTLTVPDGTDDFNLSVTATSTEQSNNDAASTTATLFVDVPESSVDGVADGATVSASAELVEGHLRDGSQTGSGSGQGSGSGSGDNLVAFFEVSEGESDFDNAVGSNEGENHHVGINNDSDGPSGSSAVFDGNNDYIEVDHRSNMEMDSGTFVLWFNTENADSKQGLFSKDSSGYDDGGHLTAFVDDGQLEVRLQSGSNSYMVQGGNVNTGAWHQMAFSFGPDGMRLYLDGDLVDSDSYTGGMAGNTEPLIFGANQWSSSDGVANNLKDFFTGEMDKMAVYDRALTPTEIANMHDEGVSQIVDNGEALVYDLDIEGTLVDIDGSETLSFEVRGLPQGVTLSAGHNDGNGTWSLVSGDLEGLTMTVDPSVSDDFSIEVVAIGTEDNGDSAESQVVSLEIDVAVEDPVEISGTWEDETLEGASGNDSLSGNSGNDELYGYSGDDILNGGSGNDSLFGEAGDDVMDGGHNNDYLSGGAGNDTMDSGSGNDTMDGGAGNDDMFGGWNDDVMLGGEGNDSLDGSGGNDQLYGGAGDDTLVGGYDQDQLYGGEGNDVLSGGDGNDTLQGGLGDDTLTGGWGEDRFEMDAQSGHDIIQDIMENDTVVFEGQEFHAEDMIFNENEDGDVVVSFNGVEGQSVTLNGVSMDDLDRNGDGDISDGYSVTEDDGKVTLTIDAQ
ncbi:MAG: DUF642 domain-containing protein [Rhodospirillales bacterium]|nr:DUF642 domain-containing protein [Rhodospirillales bacterium]MBO6786369.1 DUF642 domain-containing protein [Rhodospirillales bacterium]